MLQPHLPGERLPGLFQGAGDAQDALIEQLPQLVALAGIQGNRVFHQITADLSERIGFDRQAFGRPRTVHPKGHPVASLQIHRHQAGGDIGVSQQQSLQ